MIVYDPKSDFVIRPTCSYILDLREAKKQTRPSSGLGSCDNNDLEGHFLSKLPTFLKNSYPAALNKEPLFT